MSLPGWAARRPVWIAAGCAALQFALTIAILKAGTVLVPPAMFGKVKLVAFASTVLLPLALAQVFGLWRAVGLEWARVRPAPVFLAGLLTCLPFLALGVHAPEQASLAGQSSMQFINAFGEELLFRGVIFAMLVCLPRWQGIVLSGVLFGGMHLIHGYMDGNWAAAASQALVTSMAGMMFAAVRYATGSLWLVVLLHMLLNLSMIYSNLEFAAGAGVLFAVERLVNVIELLLAGYVAFAASTGPAARPGISPG